jgi:predicted nucleotidyltransferase
MLDRQAVLDRSTAHSEELHALGARWLALFGSLARDEGRPQSDVDLLVDLDRHTFDRYMDLKLRLEDLLGRRVDLVLLGRLKPRVREAILREAIRAA